MANKKIILAALALCVFSLMPLAAQDAASGTVADDTKKNYFIEQTEKGSVLYQRLVWDAVPDILGFEFELEQLDEKGQWKPLEKKFVETNYIDVSLPPGKYRYRVTVINLLEQPEKTSTYRIFDVFVARQPVVSSLSPSTIHFDDVYDDYVIVSGSNFHEHTRFALTNTLTNNLIVEGQLVELDPKGTRAKIRLTMSKIPPGAYTFAVTDPSGLRDATQTMAFKFQKPVDIYLSGGYAFSGFVGNRVFHTYFNADFSALGGIIRLSIMPFKRSYGAFGFNLTGSGMYLKNKQPAYTLRAALINAQLNAVYVLPIIRRVLNFDAHIGLGTTFLVSTQFKYEYVNSPVMWYWGMTLNAGTALQVYVYKKLYIEINLDHIVNFREGLPVYIIQPSLSIGWEF